MASLRQIEANRRNAAKSTGPISPEGKARSSRNAVTHGVFASDLALEALDEDPESLLQLRDSLLRHYQPANPVEEQLVESIVSLRWRLSRILRAESGHLRYSADRLRQDTYFFPNGFFENQPGGPRQASSMLLGLTISREAQSLHLLSLYESRLQRTLERAMDRLERLQRDPKRTPSPPQLLPAQSMSKNIENEPNSPPPQPPHSSHSDSQVSHPKGVRTCGYVGCHAGRQSPEPGLTSRLVAC